MTDIVCTTSPTCTGVSPAPKTIGYPPTLAWAGRYLDAESAHVTQFPLRTLFARKVRFAPERNRIYVMLGSSMAAYKMDTFFTRIGNERLTTPGAGRLGVPEQYLDWDAAFYAESDGWIWGVADGQDRLFDFDWDDRGNVYLAYGIYGWGDSRQRPFRVLHGFAALYVGRGVYEPRFLRVAVDRGAEVFRRKHVLRSRLGPRIYRGWNVTNATSPGLVRPLPMGIDLMTRNTAGDRVAIFSSNTVSIYRTDDLVRGLAPLKSVTSAGGLDCDGTNFYTTTVQSGRLVLSRFSPNTSNGYDETKISMPISRWASTVCASTGPVPSSRCGASTGAH